MNGFLLFAGHDKPVGGWRDFQGSFATREEAQAQFDRLHTDAYCEHRWSWAEVVHDLEVVSTFRYGQDPYEGIGPKWFPINR